jgi:hypothetical protein
MILQLLLTVSVHQKSSIEMEGYKFCLILDTFDKPTATVGIVMRDKFRAESRENIKTCGYFLTYLNMWGMPLMTNQLHNTCSFPPPPHKNKKTYFLGLCADNTWFFDDEVILGFQLPVCVADFATFD